MSDNIVNLVAKEDEGNTSKKEVLEFLRGIVEVIESGDRQPFDKVMVIGHTWDDDDEDGFTLYRNRVNMSRLEALSVLEVTRSLIISDILS